MALMTQIFLVSVCSLVLLPRIFGSIEKMAQINLIQSAASERAVRLVSGSFSQETSINNKELTKNISKSQQYPELSSIDSNLLKKTNKFIIYTDQYGTEVFLITNSDDVYAFGPNNAGRLGFDNRFQQQVKEPKIIPELSGKNVIDIKCGNYFCVALIESGHIYTFGLSINGVTGNGNDHVQQKPIMISIDNQLITGFDCTYTSTYLLTQSGQLYWFGYLDGIIAQYPTKVVFPSEVKIQSISCGHDYILALNVDGNAYSWGDNFYGQLGLGYTYNGKASPQMIELNDNIKQIYCGYQHSLLLTPDGKIYSMGLNKYGQLGIGNTGDQNIPKLVLNDQKEICGYRDISMSLDSNNKLFIWGNINGTVVSPVLSELNSFQEVINKYSDYRSTIKPIELINIGIKYLIE